MKLRLATREDERWINERYASVHFQPSDLARDLMVVAEVDGVTAGIGRLVPAGDDACELGGMHVLEEFRDAASRAESSKSCCAMRTAARCTASPSRTWNRSTRVVDSCASSATTYVREKLDWCDREIPDRPVILMQFGAPAPR
jgi:hypothetical protein